MAEQADVFMAHDGQMPRLPRAASGTLGRKESCGASRPLKRNQAKSSLIVLARVILGNGFRHQRYLLSLHLSTQDRFFPVTRRFRGGNFLPTGKHPEASGSIRKHKEYFLSPPCPRSTLDGVQPHLVPFTGKHGSFCPARRLRRELNRSAPRKVGVVTRLTQFYNSVTNALWRGASIG